MASDCRQRYACGNPRTYCTVPANEPANLYAFFVADVYFDIKVRWYGLLL